MDDREEQIARISHLGARGSSKLAKRGSVQTRADVQLTAAILGHLNGASVGRVSHREPTLEDAYVALVEAE